MSRRTLVWCHYVKPRRCVAAVCNHAIKVLNVTRLTFVSARREMPPGVVAVYRADDIGWRSAFDQPHTSITAELERLTRVNGADADRSVGISVKVSTPFSSI